jgi:hypothetical protein
MRTSWLDLGPRARLILFTAFVSLQLGLVLSTPWRYDRVFGIQMFNASSTISIALFRRVQGDDGVERLVHMEQGLWQARDASGAIHTFRWQDRVRDRVLGALDRTVHAKDGVDAQLFHLQLALEDVAAHLPQDADTRALVARVQASDNGRPRPALELESPVRR